MHVLGFAKSAILRSKILSTVDVLTDEINDMSINYR